MTIKKILSMIAVLSIVIMACESNENDPDPNTWNGTMSAKIDGVSWSAVKITMARWLSGQLHIHGEAADGSTIQITILSIEEAGTYPVGGMTTANLAAYFPDENTAWMTTVLTPQGTVNVSELSSSGTNGTFSFIATDTSTEKNITDGKFDIDF